MTAPRRAAQPRLLDAYPDALATIKARKIPWPVVVMHLKHGLTPGHTCGECSARLELWVNGVHHYCSRSYSTTDLAEDTPACGKFVARKESVG